MTEKYSPQKHEWGTDASDKYARDVTPGQGKKEKKKVKENKDFFRFRLNMSEAKASASRATKKDLNKDALEALDNLVEEEWKFPDIYEEWVDEIYNLDRYSPDHMKYAFIESQDKGKLIGQFPKKYGAMFSGFYLRELDVKTLEGGWGFDNPHTMQDGKYWYLVSNKSGVSKTGTRVKGWLLVSDTRWNKKMMAIAEDLCGKGGEWS